MNEGLWILFHFPFSISRNSETFFKTFGLSTQSTNTCVWYVQNSSTFLFNFLSISYLCLTIQFFHTALDFKTIIFHPPIFNIMGMPPSKRFWRLVKWVSCSIKRGIPWFFTKATDYIAWTSILPWTQIFVRKTKGSAVGT